MLRRLAALTITGLVVTLALASPSIAERPDREPIRFATYNASLNRGTERGLIADLSTPNNAQAAAVAEIYRGLAYLTLGKA